MHSAEGNKEAGRRRKIATIDGPAGVGKTTLARRLSEELQISYLDTGAMFRTLAVQIGVKAETMPDQELEQACAQWHFSLEGRGEKTKLLCNGKEVGSAIRSEEVGLLASRLAKLKGLRSALASAQRSMGHIFPLVAEGRDMGTVIFPEAAIKFFLDARPEVRALRRMHDQNATTTLQNLAELTEQIRQRDIQDRTRAIAPLRAAEDARCIDTSEMNIEEVLSTMLRHIDETCGRVFFRS